MATISELGPSPEHAKYQALMPEFWSRVEQQEAQAIERGLPARGMTEFAHTWFEAWGEQDIKKIDYCLAEECSYIDSSTFQVNKEGRQFTIDNCQASFEIFPDFAFYPQDGTLRSLPYADYFDGQWRITIPWRGIGRMSGEAVLPGLDVKLRGTGHRDPPPVAAGSSAAQVARRGQKRLGAHPICKGGCVSDRPTGRPSRKAPFGGKVRVDIYKRRHSPTVPGQRLVGKAVRRRGHGAANTDGAGSCHLPVNTLY